MTGSDLERRLALLGRSVPTIQHIKETIEARGYFTLQFEGREWHKFADQPIFLGEERVGTAGL
jgi:hypothetical protein